LNIWPGIWRAAIVIACIVCSHAARAEDDIAEDLKKAKDGFVEADSERRRILGSLYAINRRMKKITREKSHLTDELFSAQGVAKGTARSIATLEAQIAEEKVALRRRLRALYKLSGQGYVAVLFSQESPLELDQAMRGLKTIADRDYRLIRSYQRNVATYKSERTHLKRQVENLVALERRIREQEGKLVAEHKAKTAFVSGLEASQAAQIAKVQSLRAKSIDAGVRGEDEKLDSLLRPSFFENKGQLLAPIAGRVARPYGPTIDEKTRAELAHKGWLIAASRGTPIAASFDGAVAFSGSMPGYGHLIVIDHGDHYYTVYGHGAKPRQKVGDNVRRGQTIAEVGSSSWRDGDGMYFEIRHFSDSEDPARWIRPALRAPSIGENLTTSAMKQQEKHL